MEASKLIILILWWVNKSFKGKKSFSNLAYIKNSPITVFFLIYYANQFQFRFLQSLENIILNKIAYKTFICIIYMGICILLVFDIQGAKKKHYPKFLPSLRNFAFYCFTIDFSNYSELNNTIYQKCHLNHFQGWNSLWPLEWNSFSEIWAPTSKMSSLKRPKLNWVCQNLGVRLYMWPPIILGLPTSLMWPLI